MTTRVLHCKNRMHHIDASSCRVYMKWFVSIEKSPTVQTAAQCGSCMQLMQLLQVLVVVSRCPSTLAIHQRSVDSQLCCHVVRWRRPRRPRSGNREMTDTMSAMPAGPHARTGRRARSLGGRSPAHPVSMCIRESMLQLLRSMEETAIDNRFRCACLRCIWRPPTAIPNAFARWRAHRLPFV